MGDRDRIKRALELSAVEIYIDQHKKQYGSDYVLVQQQERPDVIVQNSDSRLLGLEVTHIYYDDEEAKFLLKGIKPQRKHPMSRSQIVDEINRMIEKKEELIASYSSDYTISLLIRVASPIFTLDDFESDHFHSSGLFNDIWLVSHDNYGDWSMRKVMS